MAEIVKEIPFTEAKELLARLCFSFDSNCHIFRGHSSEEYQLIPSSLRETGDFWNMHDGLSDFDANLWEDKEAKRKQEKYQMEAEFRILREFYKLCDMNGLYIPNNSTIRDDLLATYHLMMKKEKNQFIEWLPPQLYEIAALSQHYGLATRLLDWSRNPLVAAFFAFSEAVEKKGRLAIWSFNISHIKNYKNVNEKLKIIIPPYNSNPNLCAQKGVFTHWAIKFDELTDENPRAHTGTRVSDYFPIDKAVNRGSLDQLLKESLLGENPQLFEKFLLPCNEAKKGLALLNNMGYSSSSIFPGYDGVARQIKNGEVIFK